MLRELSNSREVGIESMVNLRESKLSTGLFFGLEVDLLILVFDSDPVLLKSIKVLQKDLTTSFASFKVNQESTTRDSNFSESSQPRKRNIFAGKDYERGREEAEGKKGKLREHV